MAWVSDIAADTPTGRPLDRYGDAHREAVEVRDRVVPVGGSLLLPGTAETRSRGPRAIQVVAAVIGTTDALCFSQAPAMPLPPALSRPPSIE